MTQLYPYTYVEYEKEIKALGKANLEIPISRVLNNFVFDSIVARGIRDTYFTLWSNIAKDDVNLFKRIYSVFIAACIYEITAPTRNHTSSLGKSMSTDSFQVELGPRKDEENPFYMTLQAMTGMGYDLRILGATIPGTTDFSVLDSNKALKKLNASLPSYNYNSIPRGNIPC